MTSVLQQVPRDCRKRQAQEGTDAWAKARERGMPGRNQPRAAAALGPSRRARATVDRLRVASLCA